MRFFSHYTLLVHAPIMARTFKEDNLLRCSSNLNPDLNNCRSLYEKNFKT